jgi:eukaryotic-like serine/threonine-protein kinase
MAQQQQQRYRVLEKIASGGMAEVFRAESAGLEGFKKTVAIKRVLPHLSEKKQFIGMFLDEARLSAHLSHSNCVQVFDIGVGDNTYFIVMEYVDGADLKAVIEHGKRTGRQLPIELAALMCVRICEGLSYAHEVTDGKGNKLGIVHRDMSPPNVLITRHGEVKIVDFGLARAHSQLERSEPGIIKGKFSYLSPEAALGQAIDHRTDIFAVGIILWELLAGRRLFSGESDLDTVRKVQQAKVPSLRDLNRSVTPEVDELLARALARRPEDRYQSARELGGDLNRLLFRLGKPVSSFDIAGLIHPIVSAREEATRREKKKSIIGTLIEEALFEFTSLKGDTSETSTPDAGSAPIALGSFAEDWASNLQLDRPSPSQIEAASFDFGNLAALEEDTLSGQREHLPLPPRPIAPEPTPTPSSGSQQPELAAGPPSGAGVPASMPRSAPKSQKGGGKGGLIALLLLLLIVGGAVGAYFGGLIPPDLIPQDLRPR